MDKYKRELPMVKNSTLFYFYNDFDIENELIEFEELTEPGELYRKELNEIFGNLEYSPADEILERILKGV